MLFVMKNTNVHARRRRFFCAAGFFLDILHFTVSKASSRFADVVLLLWQNASIQTSSSAAEPMSYVRI